MTLPVRTSHRETSSESGLPAWLALAYWAVFMAYNGVARETEPMHWLSLVLLPFALVYARRLRDPGAGLREALASVGLARGNLRGGVVLALAVGLALGALQLLVSNKRAEFWPMIRSGKALIAFPMVVAMLAATAGFVIGLIYVRARKNLVAAVIVHILIDALPAMTMVRFGP